MAFATTNAENLPAVPFTEEQKYLFDTRGWIHIPGVLTDGEIEEARDFTLRLHRDRESIPAHHRYSIGGPLERLTDHPIVLGFMNEFVAHEGHGNENCYGFRCEGSFSTVRTPGFDNFRPHGGNGMGRFPGNFHTYHVGNGRASSGLTRVVWELNPVEKGDGGTLFLSGSHKAAFPVPKSLEDPDSSLWDTYSCPAGSVLFFTEAICHSGAAWKNAERERISIFNCYNIIGGKWHKWEPNPQHLEEMPAKRQTLFRGVYCQDNVVG